MIVHADREGVHGVEMWQKMIKVSTLTSCYRGERYLRGFFESVAEQKNLAEIEVVLIHNEPSDPELDVVDRFGRKHPGHLRHIVVGEVEPLAQSWNRGIHAAQGRYVCIWNVDDIRTPESLEVQTDILDHEADVALVYGDMVVVEEYGAKTGVLVVAPEFAREEFLRSFHCSAFPMWRKGILDNVGLFDSQLRSGADFDLMIRIAASAEMRRAKGLLGYYLDAGTGLSTSGGRLQPTERTVVELRYGIYDKIDYGYMSDARKYRLHEICFDGCWHPVGEFFPNYQAYLEKQERLRSVGLRDYRRAQVKRLGESVVQRWKGMLRRWLSELGLLEWALSFRKRNS